MLLKRKLLIQQNLPSDMNIDWTKPIQTTGGGKARLLERLTQAGCGASDTFAVVITHNGDDGACYQDVFEYNEGGYPIRYTSAAPKLQNVPEEPKRIVRYFNLYPDTNYFRAGRMYLHEGTAERRSASGSLGCFKISFKVEPGTGEAVFGSCEPV